MNNQSMGWLGELSSMVLSMGQKLITGAEKCTSEFNSEIERVQFVNLAYKPLGQAQVEQLY